jgi:NAD(P)-dependent dehydrogenase (short-subunit alcohol dehydrogenase family)
MTTDKTILITGANRGIGLEIVNQYLANTDFKIIACCRNPNDATELKNLQKKNNNLDVFPLDINSNSDQEKLIKKLSGCSLEYVFLNAGTYGEKEKIGQLRNENISQVIHTNSISQIILAQALWPNLQKGQAKQLIVITSKMGSIGDNGSGGAYSYRASKAALNALMRSLAIDLFSQGLRVLLIHPGWVRTRMGGENGLINCEQSVSGIIKTIATYGENAKGEFRAYDGTKIPW